MSAERESGSEPPSAGLPASQWVTGAHPAAGGPPREEPEPDDLLDTGAVAPLPRQEPPPAGGEPPQSEPPADDDLASTAVTRIEPPPPGSRALQPPAGDVAGPEEVTLPPRDARPASADDVTLPPRDAAPASEGVTLPPRDARSAGGGAAPPAATAARPRTPPLEVATLAPGHVVATRRRRLLLALLLLPLPAFAAGRYVRARWVGPTPAAVEIALTSPDPGAWADDELLVAGRVQGLSEGVARLEGGSGAPPQAPLGAGSFQLRLRDLPEGVLPRTLVVRGPGPGGRTLEARRELVLRVDRTPPALELLEPAEGARLAPGPLEVRFRVRDASDVTLGLRVDGAVAQLATLPAPEGRERALRLSLTVPGRHELRLEAMDAAGRTASVSRLLELEAPPVEPPPVEPPPVEPPPTVPAPPPPQPRISVTWPAGELLGPGGLEVQVEDAGEVEVALDGRVVARAAPWRLLPQGLPDGAHRLEVLARGPGGEAREQRRFLSDGTGPELTLEVASPTTSPLRLEGSVRDAVDPAPRLELQVDDGPPAALAGLPASLELPPGEHRLRLVASDRAGNLSERRATVVVRAPAPPPEPPGPGPGPALPADALLVRIPARARDRFTISALMPDALPPGTEAEVLSGSTLLGRGALPATFQLPPGRHPVTVRLRAPGSPARSQSAWITIDPTPPVIAQLRSEPVGPTRSRIDAEVRDAGPVRVQLLLDGRPVAEALPSEVELGPGAHELVLVATDDVGNEARGTLRVLGPTEASAAPEEAAWPCDSGDPREEEAARLFARGEWSGAYDLVCVVLAEGRRLRSPYVLRARIHLAWAARKQGEPRKRHLLAALEDMRVAVLNYGAQAEARHWELQARIQEQLGRPQAAAESRARARAAPR